MGRAYQIGVRPTPAAVALVSAVTAVALSFDGRARAGETPEVKPGASVRPTRGPASDGAGEEVRYARKRSFNVGYGEQKDVGRAQLWITENGGAEWRAHGYYARGRSLVRVQAEKDGTYGFCVVLEDRAGNKTPEPEPGTSPQITIVVDTRPPELEILSPRGGFFGPERGVKLEWRLFDEYPADDCVSIEISSDGGKSWSPVATGRPAVGAYGWVPPAPPGERARSVRFRLAALDRAGNEARVESGDVVLDERPPVVSAAGPPGKAGGEVTVAYKAEDGEGAGLESVRLYVSKDAGATWSEGALDDDGASPLVWRPDESGEYGLYLAGIDRAGNSAPAPAAGADPQLVVAVRVGPKVRLLTFDTVGFHRGGSSEPLRWEAEGGGVAEKSVTLEYSLDGGGSWNQIATGQPSSGEFAWRLPRADTEKALVRVTVRGVTVRGVTAGNEAGDVARAISGRPFTIDSTPPRAVVRFDPSAQAEPAPLAVEEPPPLDVPEEPEAGPAPPEAIVRARELLAARRYEEAVSALEALLARAPLDARANVLLGQALARSTDRLVREQKLGPEEILRGYDRAAAAFGAAVRADDTLEEGHFWLGVCHYQRARVLYERFRRARAASEWAERATDEYGKALSIEPNSADEYCYAGMAYQLLAFAGPARKRPGLLERARDLFEKSLHGASPATAGRAHWHLAQFAARRRDHPGALSHARAALESLGEDSGVAPELRALIARIEGKGRGSN